MKVQYQISRYWVHNKQFQKTWRGEPRWIWGARVEISFRDTTLSQSRYRWECRLAVGKTFVYIASQLFLHNRIGINICRIICCFLGTELKLLAPQHFLLFVGDACVCGYHALCSQKNKRIDAQIRTSMLGGSRLSFDFRVIIFLVCYY